MEISVIVPTSNEETQVRACLESISDQTFPREKYEIIVSDWKSTDRTTEIARRYADRVVVTNKKGIWYGRNLGARFAKGKYLIFIDADTVIDKDYLSLVYKHLEKGFVGVSTGFRFSETSPKIHLACPVANGYYVLKNLWGHSYLMGFNIGMPKKLFDKVGGFKDIELEDIKMGEDLKKYGKTIFLAKRKVVTSPRRLENFGLFGALRYYIELLIVQKKNIKDPEKYKHLKYKKYCRSDEKPKSTPKTKKAK
ncbi:MAG: glycosyltransferase [Candidatus Aenigmarchaeota archaeon]|nr:glycosyltransferase [Candidatus Aenigmarchaeota archaeon]